MAGEKEWREKEDKIISEGEEWKKRWRGGDRHRGQMGEERERQKVGERDRRSRQNGREIYREDEAYLFLTRYRHTKQVDYKPRMR